MVERIVDNEPAQRREHVFTRPWRYILNMLIFVAIIAVLAYWAHGQEAVREQMFAGDSAYINGAIVALFFLGVAYTFHQTLGIRPAVTWLRDFQASRSFDDLRRPPPLISPMSVLLAETPGRLRISNQSARTMLDSVGARMSEAGEITRYITRLLIFLGLLGTFWGLLQTVAAVVDVVNALSASGEDGGVDALFSAISEPLRGMGTAFSSSIFGLAGSLALGFLDLQAGQAQNRFYNEVEDWLSSISRISAAATGVEGGASTGHIAGLFEQTADTLDNLAASIAKAEDSRARTNEALAFLSTELAALNDRLSRQEQALVAIKERAIDDTINRHVRSIDLALQQMAGSGGDPRGEGLRELRNEMRALSRAITEALEGLSDRRDRR